MRKKINFDFFLGHPVHFLFQFLIFLNFLCFHLYLNFRNRHKTKSGSHPRSTDDVYKEVNYSTSARDIRAGPPHYNYYISDTDSVGDHIYEVIDDNYESVIQKHLPTTYCRCSDSSYNSEVKYPRNNCRTSRSSNVYMSQLPGQCQAMAQPGSMPSNLVTIKLDKFNTIKTIHPENYYRQFNSLKTFKTHRNRNLT